MRLNDLARCLGARILTHENRAATIQVSRAFAANRMSDLLAGADSSTLLISSLSNPHLLRALELLDVPCLCLASDAHPTDAFVAAARDHDKVVLLSPDTLAETCRRVREQGLACASRP